MDVFKKSLELHEKAQGKIEINSKVRVETKEDLSLAYSPGVAEPCRAIEKMKKIFINIQVKEIWLRLLRMGLLC